MEQCCNNPYNLCDLALGCFSELVFRLPTTYTEETVTIRIKKNMGGNYVYFSFTGLVNDGWVVIDPDAIPENYFNPYGGVYTGQFLDPAMNEYPFIALDGQLYYEFTFSFAVNSGNNVIAVINVIDNSVYNN